MQGGLLISSALSPKSEIEYSAMLTKKITIPVLSTLALLTYYIESFAWPLHLGRDGLNYIMYYVDILAQNPAYQLLMVRRTPVAPILYGVPLSLWGSNVTEVFSAIVYCISIFLSLARDWFGVYDACSL